MLDYILFGFIVWGVVKGVNKLNAILGYGPEGRRHVDHALWRSQWDGTRWPWSSRFGDDDPFDDGRCHALRHLGEFENGEDSW